MISEGLNVNIILWILLVLGPKQYCGGNHWLEVARMTPESTQKPSSCQFAPGMVRRQSRVCEQDSRLLPWVQQSAIKSISECGRLFANRRWNCTVYEDGPLFGQLLLKATPESGFLHALSSAGLVHEVTHACSRGLLPQCGCDESLTGSRPPLAGQLHTINRTDPSQSLTPSAARGWNTPRFEWNGCSDNIHYGEVFTQKFTDAKEKRKPNGKTFVNLHNSALGRKMVRKNMQIRCKCHGVSGSCEVMTCQRVLPPLSTVGTLLQTLYDSSFHVKVRKPAAGQPKAAGNPKSARVLTNGTHILKVIVPANRKGRLYTDTDIVHLEKAPSYCDIDPNYGSVGTAGRTCTAGESKSSPQEGDAPTSSSRGACEQMCCGRGHELVSVVVQEYCDCKFSWCCDVKCQICRQDVKKNICRGP